MAPGSGSISGESGGFARLIDGFRERLDREIAAFLAGKRSSAGGTGGAGEGPGGYRRQAILADPLALATEFLHTYLLIHDDIMDHAEVRRGQPAAHARFRDLHRAGGLRGDADDFGRSVAILLGDLAHTYAVELFTGVAVRPDPATPATPAGLWAPPALHGPSAPPESAPLTQPVPPASAATAPHWLELNRCFSQMCEEVIGGQYLEFLLAHRGHPEPAASPGPGGAHFGYPAANPAHPADPATPANSANDAATEPTPAQAVRESELLRVLRLKSGRYTAERPIQLGALLAGAPTALREELSRYGTAVGEAFQLQDDLLGLFGDPATVGKPVGDDLREGKFTLLIHHALVKGGPADRQLIAGALGDPNLTAAEVARVQAALERTGARRAVTAMIAERLGEARRALETLAPLLAPLAPPAPLAPLAPLAPDNADDPGSGPSAVSEGLRFLSGLLDFLWEREQ
jgi:geranylgeranyl diphosphate synthase, type I